ncbi:hypothetical protein AYI83_19140 [Shewanella algae]|uniref:tetratricopeptide repeat protein n=1 Tax=Shewanella algae TaxID=38313 RepID=UPI00118337B3|nr:tetratricopeptide repeat protein [Shewanella algae]TVK92537.1 hypothetical protein AYI83_19140 [Shewanella algae]UZD58914.1 tetratricopeptide repeat protein [Shewanella algae]
MNKILRKAIELREQGKFSESRMLLIPLIDIDEVKARAHLHIAWSYDNQGYESDAVVHYEAALSIGLEADELFDAIFGLASTLRSLGEYSEALALFERAVVSFPEKVEVKPFYAMCLYNVGEHKKAMEILLNLLIDNTDAEDILNYQRAIRLYAMDLDRTW